MPYPILDKASKEILHTLYQKKCLTYGELKQLFPSYLSVPLDFLIQCGYVNDADGGHIDDECEYEITVLGSAYIETKQHETLRFWIPIVISNLIAAAALLVAILK